MPSYSPVHHTMTLDPNRLSLPIFSYNSFSIEFLYFLYSCIQTGLLPYEFLLLISTSLVRHINSAQLTKQPQNKTKKTHHLYTILPFLTLCANILGASQAPEPGSCLLPKHYTLYPELTLSEKW